MPAVRINVLVYSGPGTSIFSVKHTTWTLRRLLGSSYSISTISSTQILQEPWSSTCALLCIPGGADTNYCRILNGAGNARIRSFVEGGGAYLGFCAGGYYGAGRCEFEVGRVKDGMEVVGPRELAFFPGVCRGLAFRGFVYGSEAGARTADIKICLEQFADSSASLSNVQASFCSYYNGGGVFADADKLAEQGVEVLATYTDDLAVDSGAGGVKAAVVYRKIGQGGAILTGPHPEFSPVNLDRNEPSNPQYGELIDRLLATDSTRVEFLRSCLTKLGLHVSTETKPVPSLSQIHFSAAEPHIITGVLSTMRAGGALVPGASHDDGEREFIRDGSDTFVVEQSEHDHLSLSTIKKAVQEILPSSSTSIISPQSSPADSSSPDRILDYSLLPKTIITHASTPPSAKETPHFNHAIYYNALRSSQSLHALHSASYGSPLLYGEVVTSTNTLLEKNASFLRHLPIGSTFVATTQLSGRGRGSNAWVSPPGTLLFSIVQRHSYDLSMRRAPVVFVQYLAAMAVVKGVRALMRQYADMPVKLKWPNDIYVLAHPAAATEQEKYVKIGGILVSSSYADGEYTLITGTGLNARNTAGPTTSLEQVAEDLGLPKLPEMEVLLASILAAFEALYSRFCVTGWDDGLEDMYYAMWLHSGQVVTLETAENARVRISGITRDFGQLLAEEVDDRGRTTGRRFELQSDSNSFDFFKGLLKKKI